MIKIIFMFIFFIHSFLAFSAELSLINTREGKKLAFIEKRKDYFITEWDILVEPASKTTESSDKSNSRRFGRWKDGIIPFVVDDSIPNKDRIFQAIDYFHENTKIRLVEKTSQSDYVFFKNNGSSDCSSFIGKKGGKQVIHISDWCEKGSIIHEVLHALGFNHEQSRPDRNKFIKIHWSNIQFKYIFNFFRSPFARSYGEFDMDSIMLYPSFNGFAKNPDKPTMSLRTGETWMAQREKMSEQDLMGLEEFYNPEFE